MLMLASGALGYLSTDTPPPLVADAVAELVAGGTVLPSTVSRSLVEHLRDGGRIVVERCDGRAVQLTNREWEVLVLLGQGRSTGEIATSLVVSSGTVRSHVAALLRKLGVRDRRFLPAVVGIAPRAETGMRARLGG
jgi:DNA-binding NarL/FixJ family response regulator